MVGTRTRNGENWLRGERKPRRKRGKLPNNVTRNGLPNGHFMRRTAEKPLDSSRWKK
jgi:hypothetical protein